MYAGQYVVFTVLLFVATNVSDGTSNSLLTKLLPSQLARGFFNAGFLSSLATTGGKLVANISYFLAAITGTGHLHNNIFAAGSILAIFTLVLNWIYYKKLVHKFHIY
jgi:hypothetical protein